VSTQYAFFKTLFLISFVFQSFFLKWTIFVNHFFFLCLETNHTWKKYELSLLLVHSNHLDHLFMLKMYCQLYLISVCSVNWTLLSELIKTILCTVATYVEKNHFHITLFGSAGFCLFVCLHYSVFFFYDLKMNNHAFICISKAKKKICSWKPFVSYSELSRGDVDISHLYNLNF